jgi:DNA-nicking Smr family endonuclease
MSVHHAGGRSRRSLSAEERALWRGFVRSIKPLRGRAAQPAENATALPAPAPAGSKAKPVTPSRRPPRPAAPPPLATLEPRDRQRLARGRIAIDARIDLHGLTRGEAHTALAHFLRRSQRDGARFVVVITGKGAGAGERGILRRQVPLWLGLPELRDIVVGFETAHMAHGGEGALYVRLRRAR